MPIYQLIIICVILFWFLFAAMIVVVVSMNSSRIRAELERDDLEKLLFECEERGSDG